MAVVIRYHQNGLFNERFYYAPVLPLIKFKTSFTTANDTLTPNITKQNVATGVSPGVPFAGVDQTRVVKPLKNSWAKFVIKPKPLPMASMIAAPIIY